MGFFKREGVDVLDLTLLQRKGILKVKEIPREQEVLDFTKTDRDGFVPMSSQTPSSAPASVSSSASPAAGFDFLSSLAGNASPTPPTSSVEAEPVSTSSSGAGSFWDMPATPQVSEQSSSSFSGDLKSHPHFSELAVKVDNLEYKMDRLLEQITALESKLGSR